MNRFIIEGMLARLLLYAGLVLLIPLALSLIFGGSIIAFLLPLLISVGLYYFLNRNKAPLNAGLTPRESTAITVLSWLSVSLLYTLPYMLSGYLSPLDSFVESISGLTGTGATVIEHLEYMPVSFLFFRSLTEWLGGLGIIVIFVALFPQAGRSMTRMVNLESTGVSSSKALPRIKDTARSLFTVYFFLTLIAIAVLWIWGMNTLDAINYGMSVISTGGYSIQGESIAYFKSGTLEIILIFFMVLSAANYGIYVEAWKRGPKVILKDTEFRVYLALTAAGALLIAFACIFQGHMDILTSLREAFFHAASSSSTTCFFAADYDQWPALAKYVILLLFMVGGCGGSTAGGLKVIRIILLFKCFSALLKLHLHPRAVVHMTVKREQFSLNTVLQTLAFFFIYMSLSALWAACFMMDGQDFIDSIGLAFATMSNAGPAFGQFGPTATYQALPPFSKIIACCSMLFGRLESITLLAVFIPGFWRKSGW